MLEIGNVSLNTEVEPAIGLLTAGHRDTWFQAYSQLRQLDEKNIENFEMIEAALFTICLDDHSSSKNKDESHLQFFHNRNAHNRWFDKCVQIIVQSNGRAGVSGEHSAVDAVVPGKLFESMLARFDSFNLASRPSTPRVPRQVFHRLLKFLGRPMNLSKVSFLTPNQLL